MAKKESLLEKALATDSGSKRKYSSVDMAELAVAFLNGHITSNQYMAATGIETTSGVFNQVASVVRHSVAAGLVTISINGKPKD